MMSSGQQIARVLTFVALQCCCQHLELMPVSFKICLKGTLLTWIWCKQTQQIMMLCKTLHPWIQEDPRVVILLLWRRTLHLRVGQPLTQIWTMSLQLIQFHRKSTIPERDHHNYALCAKVGSSQKELYHFIWSHFIQQVRPIYVLSVTVPSIMLLVSLVTFGVPTPERRSAANIVLTGWPLVPGLEFTYAPTHLEYAVSNVDDHTLIQGHYMNM